MFLITNNLLETVLGIIIALLIVFYTFAQWRFQYWKRRGVPFIKPKFPFGNLENPLYAQTHFGLFVTNCYNELKRKGAKFGGIYFFLQPIFIAVDPTIVKNVLIKDFDHFVDRGAYLNEKDDPLSAHLLNVNGNRWQELRKKLSPTFTSGKMKIMFDTLLSCAPNLVKKVEKNISKPLNINDVLECFTTDVIGSCAFGLDCKSFENDDSPFRYYGKKIFEFSGIRRFQMSLALISHSLGKALGIKFIQKDVEQFFMKLIKDTIDYRKKNNIQRNDFLQLVLNQNSLDFNEIAANSLFFFTAGFETSAKAMSFVLYHLAKHQDIQEKLRSEIQQTLKKHDNKITYEAIFEMKYLGQVIDETLRICPPITFLARRCVKDYRIADEDLIIEKGTDVFIPVYGLHHDENIYSEPEKFNPDRFNNDKSSQVLLPFGEGPRNCIGQRFGLMQSRVGLVTLIMNYKFTVNEKTKEPLEIDPHLFILWVKGGLWLDAEKI